MPYDGECSVYWCDGCGRMMEIDYRASSDAGLVLKCAAKNEPCGCRRYFVAVAGEEEFNEAVDDRRGELPVPADVGGTGQLVGGVLVRETDAPASSDPPTGGND